MSSIVIAGDTSGSVTLQAPAIAGSTVITLPSTSTTLVSSQWTTTGSDIYYNTGNVGIGTTTPANPTGGRGFEISNASGSSVRITNSTTYLDLQSGTNANYILSNGANPLLFYTNGSERARISSAGDVGIGTSSPATKLAVAGGIAGTAGLNISGAGWGVLPYVANSLVIDNNAGEARLFATGANTTTNGSFLFYTGQTDGDATERVRITTGGDLLVGTTSVDNLPGGGTSNATGFAVQAGRIRACRDAYILQIGAQNTGAGVFLQQFFQAGTNCGQITVSNSNATAYQTSSDYRLKDNPQPMTGALAKVAVLKPCTWTWKNTGDEGQGFIAHEIQAVCPDAVSGTKDAVDEEGKPIYQGIDTSFLVATLTAAIKEQQALITQLQADVAALKGA